MKKFLLTLSILMISATFLFAQGAKEEREVSEASFTFTDDLGRTFTFDCPIERIAPSGNLAQMILYSLSKDEMVGLSSYLDESALRFLDPKTNELPLFGTFYGKKANLNKEALMAAGPDLVIDMGEITDLHKVSSRWMQLTGPGVYQPTEVELLTSEDGKTFTSRGTVPTTISQDDSRLLFQEYTFWGEWKARYVMVKAKNPKGFIFVDEIVIW